MRKSLVLILAVAFCGAAVQSFAQALTPADRAFFDQHISELVKIEPTHLVDPAVQKVFAAPLYEVTITVHEGDGTNTSKLIVARLGSQLVSVTSPSTDAELPDFLKMLNPGFKLATADDARTMQQALDAAYPIISSEGKKARTNRQAGNQWVFVRGVFFDSKMGYIFQTDASGRIVSAKYALKLP
jgi:hypothetical protein